MTHGSLFSCIVCNKQYTSYLENSKYCSLNCKTIHQTTKIDFEEIKNLYENGHTQTEIADMFNVSQKIIYSAFKRNGYKCRIAVKRNQSKENNSSWKGNSATYAALHYRVESSRGKPNECSVCGTKTAKRYEWANLTGKYEDVNDYMRMCTSCHRKYDKNRKNSSKHVKRTIK